MRRLATFALAALVPLVAAPAHAATLAYSPVGQPGAALWPSDANVAAHFGTSVALSADGRTALVGGEDDDGVGAAWAFADEGGVWTQQGPKLTPVDGAGSSRFGASVALSADGSTALIGGPGDGDGRGAAWVFSRSGGTWSQQGSKLEPSDAASAPGSIAFGTSVALTSDGTTALVGAPQDDGGSGSAWLFVPDRGRWSSLAKLTASDETVGADGRPSAFGTSAALTGDGSTALVGGPDDADGSGAVWAFAHGRHGWSTQGAKLAPDDELGPERFGASIAAAADGGSALIGTASIQNETGATWTFAHGSGGWTQSGLRLTEPDGEAQFFFGHSVALSADGLESAVGDVPWLGLAGAWVLQRAGTAWSPVGPKVLPVQQRNAIYGGTTVALSGDGSELLIGAPSDSGYAGAAWLYSPDPLALNAPMLVAGLGTDRSTPGPLPVVAQLVGGDAPSGTLTFEVFAGSANCSGSPSRTTSVPVTGAGAYAADDFPALVPGSYSLLVSYGGDARNVPRQTCVGSAVKATPSVAIAISGTREIGHPLHVESRIVGGYEPTGGDSVDLHGPTDPFCLHLPDATWNTPAADDRTVAFDYTPTMLGKLVFVGWYGGDDLNWFTMFNGCGDEPGAVVIGRTHPALALTASSPAAVGEPLRVSARLLGAYAPTGAVTFSLFQPSDPLCTGHPTAAVDVPTSAGAIDAGTFATPLAGRVSPWGR